MSKARATDAEVCVLIRLKREHAKSAMDKIAKGLDHMYWELPSISTLLDYLSNMISALELMLKLLSGNWDSHEVGKMYQDIFRTPHPDPEFMVCLKQATKDQKYLFEPSPHPGQPGSKSIAHYIPEMEQLFDGLRDKMRERHRVFSVIKEIRLPLSFGEYLRDNLWRFYKGKTYTGKLSQEQLQRISEEHMQQLEDAAMMINLHLQQAKGVEVMEGTGMIIECLS